MLDPSWLFAADLTATIAGLGALCAGLASLITAVVGARLSVKKGREEGRVEGYEEARRRWRRAQADRDREQSAPSGDDGYVSDDLSDW